MQPPDDVVAPGRLASREKHRHAYRSGGVAAVHAPVTAAAAVAHDAAAAAGVAVHRVGGRGGGLGGDLSQAERRGKACRITGRVKAIPNAGSQAIDDVCKHRFQKVLRVPRPRIRKVNRLALGSDTPIFSFLARVLTRGGS